MFSFHPDTSDVYSDYKYAKGFRSYDDKGDLDIISRAISKCVTSPIVWNHGQRRGANFLYADWIVLDVDDGLSIAECRAKLKGLTCVIGTTKSHGITKKGVRCDRFRVWLQLDQRCEDLEEYSSTVRYWAKIVHGDEQAVDGARKFKPCREIVFTNLGDSIQIQPAAKKRTLVTEIDTHRYIPKFVKELLERGPSGGSRNYACYSIGKYLTKNGFGVEEIVSMIMASPVPAHAGCTEEVRRAVQSSARGR